MQEQEAIFIVHTGPVGAAVMWRTERPGLGLGPIIWGWGKQKQEYRSRCLVTGVSLANFNGAMRSCLRQGVGSPLGA